MISEPRDQTTIPGAPHALLPIQRKAKRQGFRELIVINSPSQFLCELIVFLNRQHTLKMGMEKMSALGLALVILSVPDNWN